MRPGSFDTEARLADMDADGIHAQVLYPSVTLRGARCTATSRELQLACVRAYNEWLAEFCEGSDGRLVGQAIIPTTGVDDAVAELERRARARPPRRRDLRVPERHARPQRRRRPFWARAEEADIPVAVHIGSFLPTSRRRAPGRQP